MNELQNNFTLNGFKAPTPAASSHIDYSQLKSTFNEQLFTNVIDMPRKPLSLSRNEAHRHRHRANEHLKFHTSFREAIKVAKCERRN